MTATINYFLEANLVLLMFLLIHTFLLKRETNFQFVRLFMLCGIFFSLSLPFIHVQNIQSSDTIPSISNVVPHYWLPEVTVSTDGATPVATASYNFWGYAMIIYCIGTSILFMVFAVRVLQLIKVIRKASFYRKEMFNIIESTETGATFSFFNFIFIGNQDTLSEAEKQLIIDHESVHARQWHSLDTLIINILRIVFWFNPCIILYKKIFVQLHEFEADARAVKNEEDADNYCSLLARVALQSAGFSIANHFNNSLTLKRIQMLRTIKTKIKGWKLATLAAIIPLVFFIIACQDQVMEDMKAIAESSSAVLDVPPEVQAKLDALKKANPNKKYLLYEPTGSGQDKLGVMLDAEKINPKMISSLHPIEVEAKAGNPKRSFVIVEWNEQAAQLSDATKSGDVYTVVEQQPQFPGGYDALREFIASNLTYTEASRRVGVEGTVYVSFIVEKDGSISDVKTIRGISPECDNEAMRVVRLFPNWTPGMQNGELVRVRFVLPIKYKLGTSNIK